ncbi:MAG: trypsin-like serine protease [Polyangiaceae bacterium]
MKAHRLFLALVGATPLACAPADGPEPPVEELREDDVAAAEQPIVNGSPTTGDPAVVYVEMGCSGTLVTPKIVLTACHCFQGFGGNPDVFFGSNIYQSGTWIPSVHHEVHPGQCVGPGDLAMITLSQPGPATPIPVNDRDLANYIGDTVRVVGFGVTSENGSNSGQKRVGTSPLSQVQGGEMYCDPTVQSGTCYGDSGGPNFMTFEGKEYLVGATSYGTEACGSGYDVSARTDSYYDWIQGYIAQHDPATCAEDGGCATGCPTPDPDCPCAADGHCTDACPDPSVDPDCDACGPDGICQLGCAVVDSDCCVSDGDCVDECGSLDLDCADGTGAGGPGTGAGGQAASSSGAGAGLPGGPPDDDPDGRRGGGPLLGSVCSVTAPGGGSSDASWLAALLVLGLRRRRR